MSAARRGCAPCSTRRNRVTDDDRRLREAFEIQRAGERTRTPGFRGVLDRPPKRGPGFPAVSALVVAVILGLAVLIVSIRRADARGEELELARQVMSWRSPTEFLLPVSVPGLLPGVPRIDEAPPGSPLK